MLATGLTLACLTATGFYMVYRKLPARVRRFMEKHVLLTDAVACLLTYMLFGGTLVALFAAAWMGLLTSVLLAIANNPKTNFLLERAVRRLGQAKEQFIAWLAEHFQEREEATKTNHLQAV
jgi:hypothetical protein